MPSQRWKCSGKSYLPSCCPFPLRNPLTSHFKQISKRSCHRNPGICFSGHVKMLTNQGRFWYMSPTEPWLWSRIFILICYTFLTKKIDDFTMDLTTLFGERKIYFPADYLGYRNIRSRDENGVVHFLLLDFLVSCDILSVK